MSGGLTWNSQHGTQGATRGVETCIANTPGVQSLRDRLHELDEQCEGDGGGRSHRFFTRASVSGSSSCLCQYLRPGALRTRAERSMCCTARWPDQALNPLVIRCSRGPCYIRDVGCCSRDLCQSPYLSCVSNKKAELNVVQAGSFDRIPCNGMLRWVLANDGGYATTLHTLH